MKALLDTHIWLWSLIDPTRLSRRVQRSLRSSSTELWLSPISVWELSVLVDKGRVRLNGDFADWVREAHKVVPLNEAPLTHEIALETHSVSLRHPDPADRLLVATARVHELTLITADHRIIDSQAVSVLANE